MPSTTVQFPAADGRRIIARVEIPADGEPIAWAVVAHCFACTDASAAAERIALALAERRVAVLRFDVPAAGVPDAAPSLENLERDAADVQAAARWLGATHAPPSLLIGHSLGGAAAVLAAGKLPGLRAVATVAAPFAEPVAGVLAELRCPLLIFHSPADAVVPLRDAARLFTAAHHPKSFVSLDDADHLLTRPADAEYAAHVLAAWASRYVEAPPPAATLEEAVAESRVSASIGRARYRTDIIARGHGFVVDEPSAIGGSDQGPTPYDLVAAALGACTAITLRMYADRKQWPLEQVDVLVAHDRVHAEDEAAAGGSAARPMDRLTRELRFTGPLTDEQRTRLREIADRCPVHRTLEAGLRVETLAD